MRTLDHATPAVLIMLVIVVAPVFYYISQAKKGKKLFVRRISGIDAIDEACGRCAELGKPSIFSVGLTSLGPILYGCLGVLFHVAKKAARYKTRLIIPQNQPDVMAVSEEVLRDAYRTEGRLSAFDPKNVVYLSDEQFAYAAGYIGLVQREKVGSAFLFGTFAGESLVLAEAGQQVGAMQVAATTSPEQVAFFISACDYTLIGEELFAASAYLTEEPVQLGSLYAQDRVKLFFYLLIVVGILDATFLSIFPNGSFTTLTDLIYWRF